MDATELLWRATAVRCSTCLATIDCEWKDELVFHSGDAVLDCIEDAGEEITGYWELERAMRELGWSTRAGDAA